VGIYPGADEGFKNRVHFGGKSMVSAECEPTMRVWRLCPHMSPGAELTVAQRLVRGLSP